MDQPLLVLSSLGQFCGLFAGCSGCSCLRQKERLDLLLPCAPGAGAVLEVADTLGVHPESLRAIRRPPSVPGVQSYQVTLSQDGCVNDPAVHPRQRCWPHRGLYNDVAMPGADPNGYNGVKLTGYIIHMLQLSSSRAHRPVSIPSVRMKEAGKKVVYLCDVLLTEACVENLTALGCATRTYGTLDPPWTPLTLAQGGGHPPLPYRGAPRDIVMHTDDVADAGTAGVSGGREGRRLSPAAKGGLAGGLVAAALAAVAAVVLLLRRRGRPPAAAPNTPLPSSVPPQNPSSSSFNAPWWWCRVRHLMRAPPGNPCWVNTATTAAAGGDTTEAKLKVPSSTPNSAPCSASSHNEGDGGDSNDAAAKATSQKSKSTLKAMLSVLGSDCGASVLSRPSRFESFPRHRRSTSEVVEPSDAASPEAAAADSATAAGIVAAGSAGAAGGPGVIAVAAVAVAAVGVVGGYGRCSAPAGIRHPSSEAAGGGGGGGGGGGDGDGGKGGGGRGGCGWGGTAAAVNTADGIRNLPGNVPVPSTSDGERRRPREAGGGADGDAESAAAAQSPSPPRGAPSSVAAGVVVTPRTPHRPDINLKLRFVRPQQTPSQEQDQQHQQLKPGDTNTPSPPNPPNPPNPHSHTKQLEPQSPRVGGEVRDSEQGQTETPLADGAAVRHLHNAPSTSPSASPSASTTAREEELVLLPVLRGKGSFGRVVEGRYRGGLVAVKLLTGAGMVPGPPPGGGGDHRLLRSFTHEVEVLARCDHRNVVRLLAACCCPPPRLCLVMELMDTSLECMIREAPGRLLPMSAVLDIAVDIARGLEYLHPTIVHRDLKPANVLVNDPLGPNQVAKLSDFGLARLSCSELRTRHPEAGTPAYMAPECFDVTVSAITCRVDIYALGKFDFLLIGGWRLAGLNFMRLALKVTYGQERPPLSATPPGRRVPKLLRLVQRCWDQDPRRRPAAAEVAKELALVREMVRQQQQQEQVPVPVVEVCVGGGERCIAPPRAPGGPILVGSVAGILQNPNVVGSGYIQFPPQRPFEKPVVFQPPTVAAVQPPPAYSARPQGPPPQQYRPPQQSHYNQQPARPPAPQVPPPQRAPQGPPPPRPAAPPPQYTPRPAAPPPQPQPAARPPAPQPQLQRPVSAAPRPTSAALQHPSPRPGVHVPAPHHPAPAHPPSHGAAAAASSAAAAHAHHQAAQKIQAAAITQAHALAHKVQAVQLTESDDEGDEGKGGLSKSQKKRLRKKLRDATAAK
ncbi:hypothetical protein VOLCADRAFT_106826 [Volvox carteri f. nagariensis]|uniref:Protein kinase domain-containing protein n=1 Tax=Volvox carteri f. nagariensis TaxID=3068 RepID=D8UA06_VOLCA|nr:uncharacterized protein VOLCADRAFT_106826 [Volvox carteri f. nagariensis]EFJ43345.1 hypothetical protein VOLCADRAFT_106826 [Volvox carteri f. nagariensis]|eukprot:XP_002955492.1 hypothetical protein VOLCADRAFT_106826 [Volvox carteri f. nagariensis]